MHISESFESSPLFSKFHISLPARLNGAMLSSPVERHEEVGIGYTVGLFA